MSTAYEALRPVGTLLGGRYRLGPPLGEPGGQGIVYEALDLADDSYVAVKVFHEWSGLDEHELKLVQHLRHPNIIKVLGVIEVPPLGPMPATRALVMERADGSLADEIGRSGADESVVRLAGEAAARALVAIHADGSTHNDIKPHNILRVGTTWKLADFSTATPLAGTHAYQFLTDAVYAAPERKYGQVRTAGDIYSLGITLHEALVGQVPHRAISAQPNRRLRGRWRSLISQCIAPDPKNRPSAETVLRRLPKARPMALTEEPPSPAPAWATWKVVAASLAVLVALASALVATVPAVRDEIGRGLGLNSTDATSHDSARRRSSAPSTTSAPTAPSTTTTTAPAVIDAPIMATQSARLDVTAGCSICSAPRSQQQWKLKLRVTNMSDQPMQLGAADSTIFLVVRGDVGEWTPTGVDPARLTLAQLDPNAVTVGADPKVGVNDVWLLSPNADGRAEPWNGSNTFATHWPTHMSLSPGATFFDGRVKQGDLVFFVPPAASGSVQVLGIAYWTAVDGFRGWTSLKDVTLLDDPNGF